MGHVSNDSIGGGDHLCFCYRRRMQKEGGHCQGGNLCLCDYHVQPLCFDWRKRWLCNFMDSADPGGDAAFEFSQRNVDINLFSDFFVFAFYTPLSNLLQYEYGEFFRVRFPLLYAISYGISWFGFINCTSPNCRITGTGSA